ncbi:MAG: hypothetical protein JWO97_134 [Acidobacteria bacterium]|nr:hypothetical protein [Acidobacteriota bacterium]
MTIMTRHHPLTIAAFATLFWTAAAALVVAAHVDVDPFSPMAGAAATIGAIIVTAYCYTRLVAQNAGATHALSVGIAWLALSIVAEITMSTRLGHSWFSLIGSPDRPLLRNVFLFAWIFAPTLFARREESA